MGKKRDSTEDQDPADEVGYCKPPRQHQFKKGVSGNPRGRPHPTPSVMDLLRHELGKKVIVNEDGERHSLTKLQVAVKQLANKLAVGDRHAFKIWLSHFASHPEVDPEQRVEQKRTFNELMKILDTVSGQKQEIAHLKERLEKYEK